MIKNFTASLQSNYQLDNYQKQQLKYLFLTVASDISKLLLLGLLFYNKLYLYLFSTLILLILRTSTGGLHMNTYLGCLFFSILYYFLSIQLLPLIPITNVIRTLLLSACFITNFKIGAVTSSKRPKAPQRLIKRGRRNSTIFIFFYLILMNIIPIPAYICTGFWVIILHTIQLLIAFLLQKGGSIHHEE